jgi:hypothetical protein
MRPLQLHRGQIDAYERFASSRSELASEVGSAGPDRLAIQRERAHDGADLGISQ